MSIRRRMRKTSFSPSTIRRWRIIKKFSSLHCVDQHSRDLADDKVGDCDLNQPADLEPNTSLQSNRAVIHINTANVMTDATVIVSPVMPSRKNEYENSTR